MKTTTPFTKFAWAESSVPAQLLPRTVLRCVRDTTHLAGPQWELSAQHPNGRNPSPGSEYDTYVYRFSAWDDSPDEGQFTVHYDHGFSTAFLTDAAYDELLEQHTDNEYADTSAMLEGIHPLRSAGALGFNRDVFLMLCGRRSFIQAITQLQ